MKTKVEIGVISCKPRTRCCWHLDPELLASRPQAVHSCVSLLVHGVLSWHPKNPPAFLLLPFRRSHGHVSFSIVLKGGAGLVLVSMCVGSMIQEQRSEPQVLADKNEAFTEWHSPRKVRPAPWEEDLGFGVRHPGLSICWLKRLFPESRCWARPRAGLWALLFLRSRPGDGPSEVP